MSDILDYYTNYKGDLFLKYFLIDSSFNDRGWSIDSSQLARLAKDAIGKPFTDYEDFPVTPFNDNHPWSPKQNATFREHLDYAKSKATGVIVDFSPVSRNALKSGSGFDIERNNGYYVTVKVTNPMRRQQYLRNPARIPRVSPGIFDYNFTKLPATNLNNVDFVHLAGVKKGAYGEKAKLYAACSGGYNECVSHLKGASIKEEATGTKNKRIISFPQTELNLVNIVLEMSKLFVTRNIQREQQQQILSEINGALQIISARMKNNNNNNQQSVK